MSNLTQHVEQLVEKLNNYDTCSDDDVDSAARLMTAMANEIEARRDCQDKTTTTGGTTWHYVYLARKVIVIDQARRELDALVNPPTPTP